MAYNQAPIPICPILFYFFGVPFVPRSVQRIKILCVVYDIISLSFHKQISLELLPIHEL